MSPYLNITIDEDGIGYIEFFHPSHNSLPSSLLEELRSSIESLGSDSKCKVLLIKSGGDRTFCAGASLDELLSVESEKDAKTFFAGFANVINAMRRCPKLIITQVQGKAVGGGVGIIAASDFVVASNRSSIRLSELAIGIGPFVIGPAVRRKVGTASFAHMSLQPETFMPAKWAKEKGLYDVIVDSEDLRTEVQNALARFSQYSTHAMTKIKSAFWEGTDHWDDLLMQRAETSGQLLLSDIAQKAISKFKSKKA